MLRLVLVLAVLSLVAACTPRGESASAGVSSGTTVVGAPGAGDSACVEVTCYQETVSLLDLQDRAVDENVLKLFSVAVDPVRKRAYVSGIMSAALGVLDTGTGEWVGTVASGMEGRGLKYLAMDPVANVLYVLNSTSAQIARVDLDTGRVDGPVAMNVAIEAHQSAVDTKRGTIIISSRDGGLQAFGGEPFGLLYQQAALGERAGAVEYDATRDLLYVLDPAGLGTSRAISVVNPATGAVTGTITYQATANERLTWLDYDAESQRFFVGGARSVLVLGRDGSTQKVIKLQGNAVPEHMVYDPVSKSVVVLSIERPSEGRIAGTGGTITAYDPRTGAASKSVVFGRKPHKMAVDTGTGHIYVANGDASVLWSVDTRTFAEADPIRLGDSVEQIAIADGGETLYISSRLGGSYIAAYGAASGSFEAFESGTWPIPVQATPDGTRLLVLNAWDSTLSVYGVEGGRTLLATIPLGLPAGSTDRLPAMALDATRTLAYVAYPEFGKIVVANWETGRVTATIAIDNFKTGDTGGGAGEIQLAVDEARDRLYLLAAASRRLEVYAPDAAHTVYTLEKKAGATAIDWKQVPQGSDLLFLDAVRGVLFVGPVELDARTLAATGRTAGGGASRVVAVSDGRYWALGEGGEGPVLVVLDAGSLAALHTEKLPGSHVLPPVVAVDAANRRLYVGHQAEAEFDIYDLG